MVQHLEHIRKSREIRSILHLFFLFGSLTTAQNLQTTSKKPSKSPHFTVVTGGQLQVVTGGQSVLGRLPERPLPAQSLLPWEIPTGIPTPIPMGINIAAALKGRLIGS